MIDPNGVRAQVVDITRPAKASPAKIVLDANVLYFALYSNFSGLRFAGGRMPQGYQLRDYDLWLNQQRLRGTELRATPGALGEFARLAEYAEFEMLWRMGPTTPAGSHFDPQQCKKARYDCLASLPTIRRDVLANLADFRKTVQLLPQLPSEIVALDQTAAAWEASAGDFADALMVATARHCGVPHVLSDDIDLLTFAGITVYTANQTALLAARTAGKLLP